MNLRKSIVFAFLFCMSMESRAETFFAKVVWVSDGDTVKVLREDKETNKVSIIRLAEIDAPETDQNYGMESKLILADLILGEKVKIVSIGRDDNKRYIGNIYKNGKWINAEMVRLGAAWVYFYFAKSMSIFELGKDAIKNRSGLWGVEGEKIEPWIWRKRK